MRIECRPKTVTDEESKYGKGGWLLHCVPDSPESGRELDRHFRERASVCMDALRAARDNFFNRGGGAAFTAACDRAKAAEATAAAARHDVEDLRRRWAEAIKKNDLTVAENIEAEIVTAEAKVARLTARCPILQAEAEALRQPAAAELTRMLEGLRVEMEVRGRESAELVRRQLSQAIGTHLALWHSLSVESESAALSKFDVKILAEIKPL